MMNDEDELVAKTIAICMLPFLIPMMVSALAMEKVWDVYDKMFGKL